MEGLIALFILVVLAVPVLAIVGLIKAIGAGDEVRRVEARLRALEGRLAGVPGDAPAAAPPQPAAPISDIVAESMSPRAPTPEPIAAPPPTPRPEPALSAASPIVPPSPPLPPTPRAISDTSGPSFEERFGTQWVVWIGGIALALGGFFLVRFSIEQGLIGPGVRIVLGALLAVALIAAGEWTRRTEALTGIVGIPSAHIPSILTAAGTTVAYADVYAAYALYDFIGPAAAFALLGLVALATLAAALLHGPALAGLGLVGAYVTPVLVASDRPNYWALYLYLTVVTVAAFALARIRLWRWLAVTALAFSVLWTLAGLPDYRVDWLTPHNFYVVAGFVAAAFFIVSGFLFGPDAEPGQIDGVSSAALAAYLLAITAVVVASQHDPLALMTFVALVAATMAIAWQAESATAAVPAGAVLAALVFAEWAADTNIIHLVAPSGPVAGAVPEPERAQFGWHLTLGGIFMVLFGGAGFLAQGRSERPVAPMLWAAAAVFAPLAILAALYYRIAGFDRSLPFAATALLIAALFALATEALDKRAPRPGLAAACAIFATGCVAALAMAFTMALERGWLTIALALMVPAIAWIADKRPLPALRVLAALIAVLVVVRIGWEPRIVGRDVGTTPIFNWILYGYGIPAAAFWIAGFILRKRADDGPARTVDAAAILFTVLLAFLEIRHFIYGGDVYRRGSALAEIALQVCVGLAMTIGLERLRLRTRSVVHDLGALLIAALTLMAIALGLGVAGNPMVSGRPVGGLFLNWILLGYGLPALLVTVLAQVTRGLRPQGYSTTAAVVAVALALAYLTLEVRTIYHGPVLTSGPTTDAEQYTYSAVWLAFGVALLVAGVALRSLPVRFASAAVVILTILKVFFVDMSDLKGIYQALSFIGLGVVLLGIGWLYQRMLFPRRRAPAASPI